MEVVVVVVVVKLGATTIVFVTLCSAVYSEGNEEVSVKCGASMVRVSVLDVR